MKKSQKETEIHQLKNQKTELKVSVAKKSVLSGCFIKNSPPITPIKKNMKKRYPKYSPTFQIKATM